MCGIVGSYNCDVNVAKMLASVKHRGPDAEGILEHCGVTHGHCRLSIIDPISRSDQPFIYGDSVISFNGEIWNYLKVRKILERSGCVFSTNGDTEVLAAALDIWGLNALKKLEGMFAFCWTRSDGERYLVRDRFGKVPLYYSRKGDGIIWASERKGLLPAGAYNAKPLQPGYVLPLNGGVPCRYYSIKDSLTRDNPNLHSLLLRSVKARTMSDVGFCCLVSGGLDSSLILAMAREFDNNIVAYTAVLDEHSKDLESARRICSELGVHLIEVEMQPPSLELLSKSVWSIETNLKAQVEIGFLCIQLAPTISNDGYKVVLSGEGADEIFGGYGSMAIASRKQDDAGWRQARLYQLAKMARGNFLRCNNSFMSSGIECRLPFLDRQLVEAVIGMDKEQCPPGKKVLKDVARKILPKWLINRPKDTFQGGCGVPERAKKLMNSPIKYYNQEYKKMFFTPPGLIY